MAWLILLLLVPAIVVPVVVSLGFAGCGFDTRADEDGPRLTIVSAIPLTEQVVALTWTYIDPKDPNPATFDVRRKRGDADWLPPIRVSQTVATGQPHIFRDDSLHGF